MASTGPTTVPTTVPTSGSSSGSSSDSGGGGDAGAPGSSGSSGSSTGGGTYDVASAILKKYVAAMTAIGTATTTTPGCSIVQDNQQVCDFKNIDLSQCTSGTVDFSCDNTMRITQTCGTGVSTDVMASVLLEPAVFSSTGLQTGGVFGATAMNNFLIVLNQGISSTGPPTFATVNILNTYDGQAAAIPSPPTQAALSAGLAAYLDKNTVCNVVASSEQDTVFPSIVLSGSSCDNTVIQGINKLSQTSNCVMSAINDVLAIAGLGPPPCPKRWAPPPYTPWVLPWPYVVAGVAAAITLLILSVAAGLGIRRARGR